MAFLTGCYTDINTNHYFSDAYPFYVILAILITEKLA